MKRMMVSLWTVVFVLGFVSVGFTADVGTPAEAEAMVKKAIAYVKAKGQDAAFTEINNPKGQFVDRDLYIFVYDLNGKCIAHGFNQKMIGKDLLGMTDVDGKSYVKERVEIAKTKGAGWQDYKFTNPISKKIEAKSAYIEKYKDIIVGCGVYKK